jgi:hypothetical protein
MTGAACWLVFAGSVHREQARRWFLVGSESDADAQAWRVSCPAPARVRCTLGERGGLSGQTCRTIVRNEVRFGRGGGNISPIHCGVDLSCAVDGEQYSGMSGLVLRRLLLGLVLGVLGTLGCKASRSQAEVDHYFSLRDQAICATNFRCCPVEMRNTSTVEQCADSPDIFYLQKQFLVDSVERGRVRLDMSQAQSCFEAVWQLSCAEWTQTLDGQALPACQGIFTQQSANGAKCVKDYDCQSFFCDLEQGERGADGFPINGICSPKIAVGGACDPGNTNCEDGLNCNSVNGRTVCVQRSRGGGTCSDHADCRSQTCLSSACAPTCWGRPGSHQVVGT